MKVLTDGRLPVMEHGPALAQLFRELSRANNLLEDIGLTTTGTIIIDNAAGGVVLKDTQGTPHYWRLTVNNSGTLVTTDLGTTRPSA